MYDSQTYIGHIQKKRHKPTCYEEKVHTRTLFKINFLVFSILKLLGCLQIGIKV